MRKVLWIAMLAAWILGACNYDVGECWIDGQEGAVGAGGGIIGPGQGGYGDVPPGPQGADEAPTDCDVEGDTDKGENAGSCGSSGGGSATDGTTFAVCGDACKGKCPAPAVNGFSSSVFKFVTTIADDGTGAAGGWQEASANLKFVRWTTIVPESWTCPVLIGMPLRTAGTGVISPAYAASVSAAIATQASLNVANTAPDLPPGIFCSKFKVEMKVLFPIVYPSIGAKVM